MDNLSKTSTELFYHWLNQVCNDMYSVYWEGDCEDHIVSHESTTPHNKFVELINCLYPELMIFKRDGKASYNADVSNGVFTISLFEDGEITIEGIDNKIHHTYLVNYYEKEENKKDGIANST